MLKRVCQLLNPFEGRIGKVNPNGLQTRVLKAGLNPVVLAKAALLVAADRHARVLNGNAIAPDQPRLNSVCDTVKPCSIASPDGSGEPVRYGIRQANRLFLGGKGNHRKHRSKDLLLGYRHLGPNVCEDRRLHEEPTLQ